MLDELARFNKERWEALAAAEFFYTRPWLDLDPISARQRVDSQNRLGELAGQKVLCLGCGGGQQSAALALLGAQVTVLDLTDNQLAGDRRAARAHEYIAAAAVSLALPIAPCTPWKATTLLAAHSAAGLENRLP